MSARPFRRPRRSPTTRSRSSIASSGRQRRSSAPGSRVSSRASMRSRAPRRKRRAARSRAADGRAADDPLRDRVRQFREARRRCGEVRAQARLQAVARRHGGPRRRRRSKDVKKLIVIAATWGEGEPPARAIARLQGADERCRAAPRRRRVRRARARRHGLCGVLRHRQGARRAARGARRQARRGSRRLRSRFRRAGREVDRRHAEGAGAGSRAGRQGDRGRFRRQGRAEPRRGRGRGHRAHQSQLLALRQGDLSTSSCRSTARRRPTSRATRSTSMPRTIRPMSMRCCRRRGCRPMRRCAPTSSRAATSPRSRSRRVETYAGFGQRYVKELLDAGDREELDRRPPADRPGRSNSRSRSMPRSCAR